MTAELPTRTDVLVVGAGPAGSAAAAWTSRFGMQTVLADAATFPRDKTCGDGLTPRAIAELQRLGLERLGTRPRHQPRTPRVRLRPGALLPWPGGSLPDWGSAVPRTELDDKIFRVAVESGATPLEGARAVDAERDASGKVISVTFHLGKDRTPHTIQCDRLVIADGVRSPLGRVLGREWHRDTAYGVAGRSYVKSGRSDDPWISSHLELRGEDDELLPGYGWIFPLSDGEVNLGVGALATAKRPADLQIRPLMEYYAGLRREEWDLSGELRMPTSALLPMGGAVSGVAGPNWILVGDAAGCVNPLNGEGIDYGLETGRVGAELMRTHDRPAGCLAHAPHDALRRGVLDRAPPRRPHHGAAPAAHRRARRHAVAPPHDVRPAGHGQPRDRRGPRLHRPPLALGRPAVRTPRRSPAVLFLTDCLRTRQPAANLWP